jgi:phage portal protein BeeE
MVGLLERATFSNIEQQSIEYVVHTISPYVTAVEQSAALTC